MPARKKTQPEASPLQWILERGGEAVGQVLRELAAQPGFGEGVASLAKGAAKTKGRVDKNVEQLLHALNLPSRSDYDALLRKMEHLQGSLVNLNIKLDRVLAAQQAKAPQAKPARED